MTTQPKPSTPRKRVQGGLLDPQMLLRSTPDALRKLDPRTLWRTPVRFIVEIGAFVWDALCRAYAAALGFDHATGGDEVFRDLVLTRIIEPTSKQDPLRVLAETGRSPTAP